MMHAMELARSGSPLQLVERPSRPLEPGEIRIAIAACAVCRTDLHIADGELPNPHYPIIPGHEIIGRVMELGAGVHGFAKDDRVGVPWLGWTCGHCEYCRTGRENLCS